MSGPDGFWTPGEGAEELDKQIAEHNKKQLEKAIEKKKADEAKAKTLAAAAKKLFPPFVVPTQEMTIKKTYKSWVHADWGAGPNHPESADAINAEIEAAGSSPINDAANGTIAPYAPVIPLLKQALGLHPVDHYTMEELIDVIANRYLDFIEAGLSPNSARCKAITELHTLASAARSGMGPIVYSCNQIKNLIWTRGQWLLPLAAKPEKAPKQQAAPPAVNVKAAPVTGKRKIVLED